VLQAGNRAIALTPEITDNKRIEGKNRIARNAERDKRIERLYYANCSGAPITTLDICRVLQAGNRAIALTPEITDTELARVIIDFVQTIRMTDNYPMSPAAGSAPKAMISTIEVSSGTVMVGLRGSR